jgi:hypothetical protein
MEKLKHGAPEGFKGKKNIYTCEACHGHIVTVDVDEGVTPFMLTCKAHERCSGTMLSSLYCVYDQSMAASHEWYRPASTADLSPGLLEHVLKGGLLLRPVKPMGLGIAAAAPDAPAHARAINDLKEQLLIVLVNRLGSEVSIPVEEINETGPYVLVFYAKDGSFEFQVRKKH